MWILSTVDSLLPIIRKYFLVGVTEKQKKCTWPIFCVSGKCQLHAGGIAVECFGSYAPYKGRLLTSWREALSSGGMFSISTATSYAIHERNTEWCTSTFFIGLPCNCSWQMEAVPCRWRITWPGRNIVFMLLVWIPPMAYQYFKYLCGNNFHQLSINRVRLSILGWSYSLT